MPLYEYECEKCGERFEYQQPMSEAPKTVCEKCGGRIERVISAGGFILKGGGWYSDLYAGPKPGASKDSGGGETKSESKSESKSEGKSDTKADTKTTGDKASKSPTKKAKSGAA
ncbi:MAG TPA: zinc ribbon domain-containing protein [Polyangia bacterium]|nr:zinc ribbon domain-containing protein [Polyangia bacterium]